MLGQLSSGPGIFGCTEAHVHKKMVIRELCIMFQSDLHPWGSSQEDAWVSSLNIRGDDIARGDARVAARMARMNIIVVQK